MKTYQPFILVVAVALIAVALFSFKEEEPKKQYALLRIQCLNPEIAVFINDAPPQVTDLVKINNDISDEMATKKITEMIGDGWELVSATTHGTGFSNGNGVKYFHFVK